MRLWRIAPAKWALDKSCDGTRIFGGRWNSIGLGVLYAGLNIEICALEKFVHLAGVTHPPLKLIAVDIPEGRKLQYRPPLRALPSNWADVPVASGSQEFGRNWIESAKHLLMIVPSAIIPEAQNAVINPKHPAYAKVTLTIVRDFAFDTRMFKHN
jgi:RES domain-containing protein